MSNGVEARSVEQTFVAIIKYGGLVLGIVSGALELVLKVKALLAREVADWQVDIVNLTEDAKAQNRATIDLIERWKREHGLV